MKWEKVAVKMGKDESRGSQSQQEKQRTGAKSASQEETKAEVGAEEVSSQSSHTLFQNLTMNRQLLGLHIPLLSSKQLQYPMEKTMLSNSPHILPFNVAICNTDFILISFFFNVIKNPNSSSVRKESDLTVGQSTGGMQITNKKLTT